VSGCEGTAGKQSKIYLYKFLFFGSKEEERETEREAEKGKPRNERRVETSLFFIFSVILSFLFSFPLKAPHAGPLFLPSLSPSLKPPTEAYRSSDPPPSHVLFSPFFLFHLPIIYPSAQTQPSTTNLHPTRCRNRRHRCRRSRRAGGLELVVESLGLRDQDVLC